MDIYNLVSFFGIFVFIFTAWLLSPDKRIVNWRVILAGLLIQFFMAWFIFLFPWGVKLFGYLNATVIKVIDSAAAGARFVFGRLALAPGQMNESGETSLGFMLAFQAFPTIIFFSSLASILYFYRILPFFIRAFARVFAVVMRVSGAESLAAASNIFMGVESALTVKPYLRSMTASELCTVLTAGMATVSSNIMVLYVYSLREQFPSIAGHLISASLLSAPAALIMSKVIMPEREKPVTMGVNTQIHYERESNIFEAVINGANSGARMIVGISALLIAVLGLISLGELFLGFLGAKINSLFGINFDWGMRNLLSIVFYPFTLAQGVRPHDAAVVSRIIGERLLLTEVVAYHDLAEAMAANLLRDPRSVVIATYALCGFAHLASMAIFVGGIAALVPDKVRLLSKVALPALIAATLACFLTASVAGVFFSSSSVLLGG